MLLSLVEDALWAAICNPNAQGSKARGQSTFRAATPTDLLPGGRCKDRFGRCRQRIWDGMLAWPSMAGDGKDQRDIMGINLLMFGDSDGPGETPRTQALTKRG